MPTILAFDTSGPFCAVSLLKDGRLSSTVEEMKKGQAERLMPLVQEMLADQGVATQDLDAIGVGVGPGNFTGIRISVSAARGMALGLGIPAVGVSGFEARAFGHPRPVTVAIPAPRDQFYLQTLEVDGVSTPLQTDDLSGVSPVPPQTPKQAVENIAQIAATSFADTTARPAPLYVRPADAAPSRDVAPVILS